MARASRPASLPTTAALQASSAPKSSVTTRRAGTGTRITPAMDASARSLGSTPFDTFIRVHLPVLRPSVLAACLLVFVDVMKELPATLVLRPFNFDTLAVIAYQMASDERLGQAALPALTIVVAGVIPVTLLSRAISRASEANRST